jgi:hypothetical protein
MSIVAAVMLVFEKYRNREKPGESESAESRKLAKETKGHPLAAACVLGWMLFLYLLLDAIGFIVILFVFLFGLMAFFNRGKWLLNGAISVSFSLAFYFVFTELIGVPVARGILAF